MRGWCAACGISRRSAIADQLTVRNVEGELGPAGGQCRSTEPHGAVAREGKGGLLRAADGPRSMVMVPPALLGNVGNSLLRAKGGNGAIG